MFKYIIFLFFPINLFAQGNIENYIRNNTTAVRTVEPDSMNYADLEVIGRAIGNSKVVFLGEQDHGDAPTFLAKTRIIKYLHERKGFDVIAFESDFFSLTYGWDHLDKTKEAIDSFISGNIFSVWTLCNACNQLMYHYIPDSYKTNNALIISGFDNQLFLGYSYKNLFFKLDSVLKYYQLPLTLETNYSTEISPIISALHQATGANADNTTYDKRDAYLGQIKKQLGEKVQANDFWMMIIDNLIKLNLQFKYRKADYWKSYNLRDEQMASNLKWLCEMKYPDKKIIIWAANYHISKYNSHYPEDFLNNAKTMGAFFTADSFWNNRAYIIGFTSYGGKAGRLFQKKYDVPKPISLSFENWINKEYNYSFTDFRAYNSRNPDMHESFFMAGSIKGNALHTTHKAEWNNIFDGVFFIRNMYPCERIAK